MIKIIIMSDITPDTKVKMSIKDWAVTLIALGSAFLGGMTYFGVIPTRAEGQVVDPITKSEIETTYVKKEKLQDTINLVEYRFKTLENEVKALKEEVMKNQDKTDDKLDKILNRLP